VSTPGLLWRIRDDAALEPPLKLLLMTLALYAYRKGEAFPSAETLAGQCGGVTPRSIRRQLRELWTRGYLQVATYEDPKTWQAKRYRVTVPPDRPPGRRPFNQYPDQGTYRRRRHRRALPPPDSGVWEDTE
jgi:hypothetical protein